MVLGFTSGMYLGQENYRARLKYFKQLGCNALEIHVDPRLDALEFKDEILEFDYVSIHTPVKNIYYDDSVETKIILDKIDNWTKNLNIKLVVVHPDLIKNPEILKDKHWPLALENMDWRKQDGKYVDHLERWFSIFPQAKMVLDLNHILTNDTSLKLADQFYEKFSDRISQIHLSGFIDEVKIHEPITTSGCTHLTQLIKNKNLPVIMEVDTANLDPKILESEFEFVRTQITH